MYCKIWPIKAHIKKGATPANIAKGLVNSTKYVCDENKIHGDETINPFKERKTFSFDDLENEITKINTEENFQKVIDYMSNEHKTRETFVSGYLCDPDFAIVQFMQTKIQNLERVHKVITDDLGNQGYHIVQSFPDDLDISDEEVHQCGIELCKKLGKYQAVITSHLHPVYDEYGNLKGRCKHNHILINSHMNPEFIDPEHPEIMKYNDCKETYAQLRMMNDEIAIEHGLPIIEEKKNQTHYSWYGNEMENQGKSWKQRIRLDIEEAMNNCNSWMEYLTYMEHQGYEIKQGKYETYITPDKEHKARGETLGREYTKEYLMSFWKLKKEMNDVIDYNYQKNNEVLLTEETIVKLLQNPNGSYYTKLPRINKRNNTRFSLTLPIKYDMAKTVTDGYLKDDLLYPIYNIKNEFLGRIMGSSIKNIILYKDEEHYLQQKKWEEEETKRLENAELFSLLKDNDKYYSVPGWNETKTNSPYRISRYDDLGRKRSLIEHILIFAMVVVNKEMPESVLSESQKEMYEKKTERYILITAKKEWKSQKILEALIIAKEENIGTLEELEYRLNLTGKEYSKTQAALRRNTNVKQKMQNIYEALNTIELLKETCEALFNMEDGPEKNKLLHENDTNIKSYKHARAVLFHHKIDSDDKIKDFKERWKMNQDIERKLQKEIENNAIQYRKLKKLKYQVELSLNKEYCYGIVNEQKESLKTQTKELEKDQIKEQKKEQDK